MDNVPASDMSWGINAKSAVLEVSDDLGIDLSFCAQDIGGPGLKLEHQADLLWPGASLYKTLAAIALYRVEGSNLSAPVTVGPEERVPGGAGLSLMEDQVTLTWRELMRWMLIGSDNTSASIIRRHVGVDALNAVARDAGLEKTRVASTAETVQKAVEAARAQTSMGSFAGNDCDDDLVDFARKDHVLGSLTTASEQTKLLAELWAGRILDPLGTEVICGMMHQDLSPHRISRMFSYEGVQVAGKTGSWGPFRHHSAVVSHRAETPIAVSVLTRSLELDRFLPVVDDSIGEIAAILVNSIRAAWHL